MQQQSLPFTLVGFQCMALIYGSKSPLHYFISPARGHADSWNVVLLTSAAAVPTRDGAHGLLPAEARSLIP